MATEATIDSTASTFGVEHDSVNVRVHDDNTVVVEQDDSIVTLTDEMRAELLDNIESAQAAEPFEKDGQYSEHISTIRDIRVEANTYSMMPSDVYVEDTEVGDTILLEGADAVETLRDTLDV